MCVRGSAGIEREPSFTRLQSLSLRLDETDGETAAQTELDALSGDLHRTIDAA